MRQILTHLLILFYMHSAYAQNTAILDGAMNARSSANFRQSSNNVLFVLEPGTQADILSYKKMPSGNYGFKIKVTSGIHRNKEVWVYYNVKHPNLRLDAIPEAAKRAEVIRQTQASRDVPADLQEEVASEGEICKGCASSSSSPLNSSDFRDEINSYALQSPVVGAYRVMAAMYQSCSVLQKAPYDPKEDNQMNRYVRTVRKNGLLTRIIPKENLELVANTHYYLKDLPPPSAPQCYDMKKTPPIYHYGGRPSFEENTIDIFTLRKTGGAPFVGIDCSAFVSSAFSMSGLKLKPGVKKAADNIATSGELAGYTEKNSCFKSPVFTQQETLKSGDVIAFEGHTYMIDKVGNDPFGFDELKRRGVFPKTVLGCRTFDADKNLYDFSLVQSTGTGSLPAMRIKAKDYNDGKQTFNNIARVACMAVLGKEQEAILPNKKILRHKGAEDPKCIFLEESRPKLRGEECTNGCKKEIIEELV